jgi:hypothetical protein
MRVDPQRASDTARNRLPRGELARERHGQVEAASGNQDAGAAPQLHRKLRSLALIQEAMMDMLRVQRVLPVFGGVLYVMLSVLFGSVWYAALSLMLTRLE